MRPARECTLPPPPAPLTLACQTDVRFQLPDRLMEVSRSPAPLHCVANQRAGVLSRSGRGKGVAQVVCLLTDPNSR